MFGDDCIQLVQPQEKGQETPSCSAASAAVVVDEDEEENEKSIIKMASNGIEESETISNGSSEMTLTVLGCGRILRLQSSLLCCQGT